MGLHLTPAEKEFLIKRFRSNPDIGLDRFCMANSISSSAFRKWIIVYDALGADGLADKRYMDVDTMKLLPDAEDSTDGDMKRALMLARIEIERLKKNYTVKMTPDGESVYIPLRKKTSG
ncbi:MAG: hypothetical protein LUE27_03900 [Clostridia bacterium]|nr:hypothetical protein [Clostridia bacterium]